MGFFDFTSLRSLSEFCYAKRLRRRISLRFSNDTLNGFVMLSEGASNANSLREQLRRPVRFRKPKLPQTQHDDSYLYCCNNQFIGGQGVGLAVRIFAARKRLRRPVSSGSLLVVPRASKVAASNFATQNSFAALNRVLIFGTFAQSKVHNKTSKIKI